MNLFLKLRGGTSRAHDVEFASLETSPLQRIALIARGVPTASAPAVTPETNAIQPRTIEHHFTEWHRAGVCWNKWLCCTFTRGRRVSILSLVLRLIRGSTQGFARCFHSQNSDHKLTAYNSLFQPRLRLFLMLPLRYPHSTGTRNLTPITSYGRALFAVPALLFALFGLFFVPSRTPGPRRHWRFSSQRRKRRRSKLDFRTNPGDTTTTAAAAMTAAVSGTRRRSM